MLFMIQLFQTDLYHFGVHIMNSETHGMISHGAGDGLSPDWDVINEGGNIAIVQGDVEGP